MSRRVWTCTVLGKAQCQINPPRAPGRCECNPTATCFCNSPQTLHHHEPIVEAPEVLAVGVHLDDLPLLAEQHAYAVSCGNGDHYCRSRTGGLMLRELGIRCELRSVSIARDRLRLCLTKRHPTAGLKRDEGLSCRLWVDVGGPLILPSRWTRGVMSMADFFKLALCHAVLILARPGELPPWPPAPWPAPPWPGPPWPHCPPGRMGLWSKRFRGFPMCAPDLGLQPGWLQPNFCISGTRGHSVCRLVDKAQVLCTSIS